MCLWPDLSQNLTCHVFENDWSAFQVHQQHRRQLFLGPGQLVVTNHTRLGQLVEFSQYYLERDKKLNNSKQKIAKVTKKF